MSEPEKKTGEGGSTLMVDKTLSDQHMPFRPIELQGESSPELHNRTRAPAIPFLVEDLKDTVICEASGKCENVVSSEKHTHVESKFSSDKRKGAAPETIAMVLMDETIAKETLPTQPIPAPVELKVSKDSNIKSTDKSVERKKSVEDSITVEVEDVRTAEGAKAHSEWSDDEEAGGLPRSESRASRISRAVRQLFCCGVTYNAPSEENITPRPLTGI